MKTHLLVVLAIAVLVGRATAEPFVVHEWGTFTTVSGSDGKLLSGLEREEHALPPFVQSHAGFSPAKKGWARPVANVTVKMETPVIYFYSDGPREVTVDVQFHGGSISQWYPERTGGEILSPAPTSPPGAAAPTFAEAEDAPPMDFSRKYLGSASWKLDVLPRASPEKISARSELETAQWPRARVPAANKIRGPKGEVEGFVFYRGIGNFALPLQSETTSENLVLHNTGPERIPFLFVYEKSQAFRHGVVRWSGALESGRQKTVPLVTIESPPSAHSVIETEFSAALQQAGLSRAEARVLIATWQESYFDRDGLRVFWIVPRKFTDAVLPIKITPAPDQLERVLVGRSEILTPAFEAELRRDFASARGKSWENDRYYLAYRERARQLGVVLAAAQP
jgi:hypothetical protein